MKQKIIGTSILLGSLWGIHFLDFIIPGSFHQLGILPRSIPGLKGIIFAPFLHGNLMHLVSNSLPIFILTLTLFIFYPRLGIAVWLLIAVLSGALVWLFARGNAVHIGASGVIYGLASFLIASGIFRRNIKALLIAIVIFFLYGGIIWGVMPTMPGVSWEAHLAGFLVGILLAYIFRNTRASKDDPVQPEKKDNNLHNATSGL